jgi:predicted kinase
MELVLMCGLPGSGKSTIANNYFLDKKIMEDVYILNRDKIREMLCGTYQNYDFNPFNELLVVEITKDIIKKLIILNKSIILDETNLMKSKRKDWIDFVKDIKYDIKIKCLFVNTDVEICKHRRNKNTKGITEINYWDKIIDEMNNSFDIPDENEFDELIIIGE